MLLPATKRSVTNNGLGLAFVSQRRAHEVVGWNGAKIDSYSRSAEEQWRPRGSCVSRDYSN